MTTMRLSEAIRLGSMATMQGFGADSILSSSAPCALGSAALAGGLLTEASRASITVITSDLVECWPILKKEGVLNTIWILNDRARWSREQIADWVEKQEIALGYYTPSAEVAEAETVMALVTVK